jgi:hypothetical protein
MEDASISCQLNYSTILKEKEKSGGEDLKVPYKKTRKLMC